ncbi:hypothetical protein AB1282_00530 [Gottfriedia sp. S16(2024)]|uniref:hypothetical protein n=1 Tax=Gottfriedia sp. S16(2024) TaxID=3162883 RepID=UPI003D1E9249
MNQINVYINAEYSFSYEDTVIPRKGDSVTLSGIYGKDYETVGGRYYVKEVEFELYGGLDISRRINVYLRELE